MAVGSPTPDLTLTVTSAAGRPVLTLPRARLQARMPSGNVAQAPLRLGTVVIGTGEQCGLRVEDSRVSRQHAEVLLRDGIAVVRDLNSKNGTWVGSARIWEASLLTGVPVTI